MVMTRNDVQLYWRLIGISIRSQMQYRASFLMNTFGQCLAILSEFFGVWVLFARFGSLRGWSLPQVALLYGVMNCGFAFADGFARGFDIFPTLVKSGDFDRFLLRPRSTALQVAGQELQLMRIGRLLQGFGIMAWACSRPDVDFTAARALLIALSIVGTACLFFGLFVLQATFSFWTVESLEIWNAVTYGGIETGQFPFTIYRPWFRSFFTFVIPLACVNFFPMSLINHHEPNGVPIFVLWASPFAGLLFMLLCLQAWRLGERKYCSTGS